MGGFVLVVCLVVACCSHRCRAPLFGYAAAADNATTTTHDHASPPSAVSTFSVNTNPSRAGQGLKPPAGDMDEWSHTLNDDEEGGRGHGISSLVASAPTKTRHAKEIPLQPLLSRPPAGGPSSPSSQQKQQQQSAFDFSMENPLKQPPSSSSPVAYSSGEFAAVHSSSGHSHSHPENILAGGGDDDDPFANSDPFAAAAATASSSPLMGDLTPVTTVPLVDKDHRSSSSTSKTPPPNPFQANPPPPAAAGNHTSWDWLDQGQGPGGAAPLPKAPSQRHDRGGFGGAFGETDNDEGGL